MYVCMYVCMYVGIHVCMRLSGLFAFVFQGRPYCEPNSIIRSIFVSEIAERLVDIG